MQPCERVTHINKLWFLNDYFSKAYEDTRKVLETSDIEEGVQLFIAQHQTGTKRPGTKITAEIVLPKISTDFSLVVSFYFQYIQHYTFLLVKVSSSWLSYIKKCSKKNIKIRRHKSLYQPSFLV